MQTEPDQKDVDPLILSAHAAAEEPEESAHGDPIEEDVVEDSMEADEAPPFNMLRFLQDAQADRAASAAATEQEVQYPANWSTMSSRAKLSWKQKQKKQRKKQNTSSK